VAPLPPASWTCCCRRRWLGRCVKELQGAQLRSFVRRVTQCGQQVSRGRVLLLLLRRYCGGGGGGGGGGG